MNINTHTHEANGKWQMARKQIAKVRNTAASTQMTRRQVKVDGDADQTQIQIRKPSQAKNGRFVCPSPFADRHPTTIENT